jgi:hypothetical protein
LFVVHYITLVMADPKGFLAMAKEEVDGGLKFWFAHEEVRGIRGEIAELVRRLAREQRQEGGVLPEGGPLQEQQDGELDIPDIDFMKVITGWRDESLCYRYFFSGQRGV